MKLRYKLTLGFFVVVSLTCITGVLSVQHSKNALKKSIKENSIIFAQETLDKINRNINSRIEDMQTYSKDTVLQALVSQSNQKFDAMESPQDYINEKDREWIAAPEETVTPFMQGLIDNEQFEELKEKVELLEERYGYKIYSEIFVTNKYGANVGQTNKTSDYYQADEEWWGKAREDGLFTGDVAYDKSSDSYSIDIGIRIEDRDGNFAGVLKAVLSINEVINMINEIGSIERVVKEKHIKLDYGYGHSTDMEMKLLNKDGQIIISSKADDYVIMGEFPRALFSRITNEKQAGSFIASGDTRDEGEELFSYAHSIGYRDFNGLGWVLVIEQRTEELFAPINELKSYILAVSLSVTLLGILIGFVISISITTSIKKLRDATIKIGKGELDTKINITSKDEIAELADSFNKMTEELSNITSSRDELNSEIAERVKAEESLKRLRRQIELILNSAGEGIYGLDTNGNTTFVNPAAARMIGWTAEELLGKSQHDLVHHTRHDGTTYPREECHIYKAFKDGIIRKIDNEVFWRKDGSSFPVEYISTPIRDEDDRIAGAVVTFMDITDRKKAEDDLKQSHATIMQQEKMASIGQLAAGVAHEINNPTGFINSNLNSLSKYICRVTEFMDAQSEALESSANDEIKNSLSEKKNKMKIDYICNDIKELLTESLDGTDRIKNIVNNLKGFARLDDNTTKNINLNQCLDATLNVVWNELKYKTTVEREYGELPPVHGYPQQLTQVFVNILINAAQAIEKQGEIHIKTYNSNGSNFVIISDTGCGIPEDKINKIFEPFFTTKDIGKGTGLGMSIAYDIVQKHKGSIHVESEVNAGTTFKIELPTAP